MLYNFILYLLENTDMNLILKKKNKFQNEGLSSLSSTDLAPFHGYGPLVRRPTSPKVH
jgi:hypothetical protein